MIPKTVNGLNFMHPHAQNRKLEARDGHADIINVIFLLSPLCKAVSLVQCCIHKSIHVKLFKRQQEAWQFMNWSSHKICFQLHLSFGSKIKSLSPTHYHHVSESTSWFVILCQRLLRVTWCLTEFSKTRQLIRYDYNMCLSLSNKCKVFPSKIQTTKVYR